MGRAPAVRLLSTAAMLPGEFAPPIARLIDELMRLPTIGPKSAARLAFHLLGTREDEARRLAAAIIEARERVRPCRLCFNLAEDETCRICSDASRDATVICVVADPRDVAAMERSREYRGRYHVLGGLIAPMDGVGPSDLTIEQLCRRVRAERPAELILATDPNVSGETTAMYISRLLSTEGVRMTRLAYGLPHGMHVEYADELTLARSLRGRRPVPPSTLPPGSTQSLARVVPAVYNVYDG